MYWLWNSAAAFFSGTAASLGIGGGGILLLYLVLALQEQQLAAQGINLLFFIPCALISIVLYTKNRLINWKTVLPILLGGLFGVGLGSYLASVVEAALLRKVFGVFLLVLGAKELFAKKAKMAATEKVMRSR